MKKGLLKRVFFGLLALVTLSACSTDILDGLIPENDSKSIIRTENSVAAERLFDGDLCLENETAFPCADASLPPTGSDVSWQHSGDSQDASQYPVSVEIDLGEVYPLSDIHYFNANEAEQEGGALTVYVKRNLFDTWQPLGMGAAGEADAWARLNVNKEFEYNIFSRYIKLEFATKADFFNISEVYFTTPNTFLLDNCSEEEQCAPGRGSGLVP